MFMIFLKHRLLTGCILWFLLLSILCQIISGVLYQNMIIQSGNMPTVKNKFLKQCKQKYANYYKLNGKMANTAVFVDRYLQGICFAKLSLTRWAKLSGQFMMLSVLSTGISIYFCLKEGSAFFEIIPYYFVSILELYLYFSITGFIDLQEKQRKLKINLMDYLENHYAPRLEVEKETALEEGAKKREIYAKEFFPEKEQEKEIVTNKPVPADSVAVMSTEIAAEDIAGSEELESLLKEFFA